MTETIATIKEKLASLADPHDARLLTWRQDKRCGVQKAIALWEKRLALARKKQADFNQRFNFERDYWLKGVELVAGVDEVGRGPLAGPVVAAAVILPHDFNIVDVIDSKQVTQHKREQLYEIILDQAVSIGIGSVDAKTIDEINIYEAARQAMTEAINNLAPQPQALLIDAMQVYLDITQQSLIKGDARSNSIGAASIVAKVIRDKMMTDYDKVYPGYDFAQNAGYGTKKHLAGIDKLGVTPIHRWSFQPVHDAIVNKKNC